MLSSGVDSLDVQSGVSLSVESNKLETQHSRSKKKKKLCVCVQVTSNTHAFNSIFMRACVELDLFSILLYSLTQTLTTI